MLWCRPQVCVSMATGVCVLLSVYVGVCAAFNLDTEFPLLKTGTDRSLFGLSVALHQNLRTDSYLLLVGAPREKAEPNVPAKQTGGVYSCPITANQSDCNFILSDDLIEDMWLGVSVASQGRPGGRVLACGHRFVKLYGAFQLRHMIGRCYLRGNDLRYNESDFHWQNPDQACSHLGDVTGEVMCNMGISASITQTEVIVGSPGSYVWQGDIPLCSVIYTVLDRVVFLLCSTLFYSTITVFSFLLAVKRSGKLVIQQTLRGQQTGSYFGNAVATADLNNDGWNDLLVGAPFFFQRHEEAGGAVYVYMNRGGMFDSEPSVVLRGPAGSAFGMAITAAGDLNQDGFQDFAVGAPFHETGSVMIWTGSSEGISLQPSQVIHGSSVSLRFRTFGYSLSAGVDVDGNKYPDLLVGSLDDTVALLRSRPVVQLNKTLRFSCVCSYVVFSYFCVFILLCFLTYVFSCVCLSAVHFTVTADVTSLKPRLRFRDNGQSVFSGYLSMPKKRCQKLSVGLQSPIRNKVEPLVFSLNASLYEKFPRKRTNLSELARSHCLTLSLFLHQIHIQKACGSDNRCESNLQMAVQQDGIQVLNFNGSIRRLFLEVNVSNTPSPGRPAEDAHNTQLNMNIPPSLIYSGICLGPVRLPGDGCSAENSVLNCELGNPFRSKQKVQVFIKFQPSEISLDTREIRSLLQLSTLSEQLDLAPVSVSMLVEYSLQTSFTLKLFGHLLVSFCGHVIGESAMRTTEDVGSLLLFTLQVTVHGKPLGHLGNLEVEFDWPREATNGKWLLYLTEIRLDGTSEPRCDPPDDIVNPLNLVVTMATSSYDCVHGLTCVRFVCPLINMNNSATLMVQARLWNSTMIEDYSDARSVLVRFGATLKLQTNKPTINMESHSSEVTAASDLQVDRSAPLWIIVVSVLAGVLLLALICLLLWKCGFFRRASTRQLYQAKTQKAHMKSQPSESDRLTEAL
uniref:Uncharacterized protein n=1 Tax=Amphiprion percula TaxID=161767 RepID=A0A3P8SJT5_AMPPE